MLSFLSHENGAEGGQAGDGLTGEHTTCAEEQGVSDTGFHDRELTVGSLPPQKGRRRWARTNPTYKYQESVQAEKKKNKPRCQF